MQTIKQKAFIVKKANIDRLVWENEATTDRITGTVNLQKGSSSEDTPHLLQII